MEKSQQPTNKKRLTSKISRVDLLSVRKSAIIQSGEKMNNIVICIQLEHNIKMVHCFHGKITGTVFPVVICYQQRYHRRQRGLLCHDTCPILQGILTCCHEAYIMGYYYYHAYLASGNQAKFQSFMKTGNFFLHHIHAYRDFHPAEKSLL